MFEVTVRLEHVQQNLKRKLRLLDPPLLCTWLTAMVNTLRELLRWSPGQGRHLMYRPERGREDDLHQENCSNQFLEIKRTPQGFQRQHRHRRSSADRLTNIPLRSMPRKRQDQAKRWLLNAVSMTRRQATLPQVVQLPRPTTTSTTTATWGLPTHKNIHGGRQAPHKDAGRTRQTNSSHKDGKTRIPVT